MLKKFQGWTVLASVVFLAGCATTSPRNTQADIDAANARQAALQGQLDAKDQELTSLKNQANDQRMAKEAAEAALQRAQDEKRALADQLQSAEAKKAKAYPSDLK